MAQESTSQEAQDICPANTVCLWTGNDFNNEQWQWSPGNGYRDLPDYLQDNVGSFIAKADCVFIADGERRAVHNGDYRRGYGHDIGGRMDAITTS